METFIINFRVIKLLFCFNLIVFIFRKLYVCRWLNPLFKTGYKRQLNEEDLYNVLPEDRSDTLSAELQR